MKTLPNGLKRTETNIIFILRIYCDHAEMQTIRDEYNSN